MIKRVRVASDRQLARFAWALWVFSVAVIAIAFTIPGLSDAGTVDAAVLSLAFGTVGALVASHQSRNPVGWLYLAFGVNAGLVLFAERYSYYGLVTAPGSLPVAALAASFAAHVWHTSFGLFVFSILLFPTGHLPSRRWRWPAGFALVVYAIQLVSGPFDTDFQAQLVPWSEPLVHGAAARIGSVVFTVALLVSVLLFLPVSGASLLFRLRRTQGAERQQIKWFAYGVAFAMMAFPPSVLIAGDGRYGVWLIPLIPISAGIAIMRYRLYDIDVVINKTVVYGALTLVLAAAYLVLVLLLQAAFESFTSDSGVAVAASTLAVAALFRPLRNRIQAAVNRRFYRQRYDATVAADSFAARLRDTVDLAHVAADLTGVIGTTLQPAHVSLWLREPET